MIRLVIIDDHPVVREGAAALLRRDPEIEIVGEAGTAADALRLVQVAQPDVVLLDYLLPDGDGAALCTQFKTISPRTEIVILTGSADIQTAKTCMSAGVRSFITKDFTGPDVAYVVRSAAKGVSILHPPASAMASWMSNGGEVDDDTALTPEEARLLTMLAQGNSNRQISVELRLSVHTVKARLMVLMRKLHVTSRAEAVATAFAQGLIKEPLAPQADVTAASKRPMRRAAL